MPELLRLSRGEAAAKSRAAAWGQQASQGKAQGQEDSGIQQGQQGGRDQQGPQAQQQGAGD